MGLFDGVDMSALEHAYMQRQQQREAQAKIANQPKQIRGRGGPLTAFISEGGAAGGAALGATYGSLLGPVGTLVGAGLGGLAGGFSGKLAEDKIRDNEYRPGAAATEGAVAGLTSAIPVGSLLKYGKDAGVYGISKLAGKGAQTAATSLEDAAAADIGGQALKTSMAGKLDRAYGRQLADQYGTIGKNVARKTKPEDTFRELASYGLTQPEDVERVAHQLTTSDGIVSKAVLKAAGQGGPVNVDGLQQVLDDAIGQELLTKSKQKPLQEYLNATIAKLHGGNSGSITPTAHPNDVLDSIKQIERKIADLKGQGGNYHLATSDDIAQARVLGAVRDELRDRLHAVTDPKSVLTDDLREQLVNLAPDNPQWQQFVDGKVMKANDLGELRSTMAPFVKALEHIDEASINSATFGGRATSPKGAVARILAPIINPVAKVAQDTLTEPMNAVAAKTTKGAADMLAGKTPAPAFELKAPSRPKLQAAVGAGIGNVMNGDTTPAPTRLEDVPYGNTAVNQPEGAGTSGAAPASNSPYSQENLMYDIQRDPQHADDYINYYKQLDAIFNPTAKDGKLNATSQKALSQSANGEAALKNLQDLYENAGGGSGRIGGTLESLAGNFNLNNNVKAYNSISAGSVAQIAKALGETGTLSDSDRLIYSQLLPQVTDTPEVARAKFAALAQRLQAARDNTLRYGAGSDLESAIAAQQ